MFFRESKSKGKKWTRRFTATFVSTINKLCVRESEREKIFVSEREGERNI